MNNTVVTVNKVVLQDNMKYNGETVLTYKIEYPQFRSPYYQMPLMMINRFYRNQALSYQRQIRNRMFRMAVKDYLYSVENGFPVHVYEVLGVYEVTYNMGCIISLYYDKYEYTGGAHGNTTRYSQTFNLQKDLIRLPQLFRCSLDYKMYILEQVTEQIKQDPSIYFDDYEKLIVETFDANSFYCTPEGIVFYYQQYAIAPYSSGIREFLIPYTDCVINPITLCKPI